MIKTYEEFNPLEKAVFYELCQYDTEEALELLDTLMVWGLFAFLKYSYQV